MFSTAQYDEVKRILGVNDDNITRMFKGMNEVKSTLANDREHLMLDKVDMLDKILAGLQFDDHVKMSIQKAIRLNHM